MQSVAGVLLKKKEMVDLKGVFQGVLFFIWFNWCTYLIVMTDYYHFL